MVGGSPAREQLEESVDDRPAKRRRVAIACQACRERKSKCCGGTPVCTVCRQMSTTCTYPKALTKTDELRQDVTSMVGSLEDRMGRIESLLRTLESRQGTEVPATPASQPSINITSAASADEEIELNEDSFQAPVRQGGDSDGIGIVPLSSRDDCAFFGPSSNIAFLRLVSRALAKVVNNARSGSTPQAPEHHTTVHQHDPKLLPVHSEYPCTQMASQKLRIPPDHKARELISGFFGNCGQVHPYLHESRFMDTYNELRRTNFRQVRRSWLALLYAVFAISCATWPYHGATLAQTNPESESWYQLASDICLKQVFSESGVNLESVQCLLLMTMYLQGTHSSMKTVFTLGIAVKLAYQLGLHSAEASKSADPIEGEVRKRVWFGLVFLDRALSMTIGRPAEILNAHSTHTYPQVCVDAEGRDFVKNDKLTVPFLHATLDMYKVLQRTVDTLFNSNCGSRASFTLESFAKVYALEADLVSWTRTLPHDLAIIKTDDMPLLGVTSDPATTILNRHKTIITLRYLSTRILIHRPVLEGLLDAGFAGDSDVQHLQIMRQASINSIKVETACATQLITVIHYLVSGSIDGHQALGAWWFSLFYVFNSSLVILGSLLVSRPRWDCPEILSKVDRDTATQALQQSLEVLDGLDRGHSTVARCRSYLKELINAADSILLLRRDSTYNATHSTGEGLGSYGTASQSSPNGATANTTLFSTPLQQFASDVNLENFLFPLDMQNIAGHPFAYDQPFV